jgi:poly-beta-1,6-N-acetyl-D-glucosamine biosynthesis protein PgaD
MSQPIINRPDLQSFQQKYGQSLITVLFWILFFFFLRPLIGMVGWFFGLQLFTDIMLVKGGYHALLQLLGWYLGVIFVMGALLKCWALYNLFRYGRHEKRLRQPVPVTVAELAQHFQVDPGQLQNWQTARRVILEHDDNGRLIDGRT